MVDAGGGGGGAIGSGASEVPAPVGADVEEGVPEALVDGLRRLGGGIADGAIVAAEAGRELHQAIAHRGGEGEQCWGPDRAGTREDKRREWRMMMES